MRIIRPSALHSDTVPARLRQEGFWIQSGCHARGTSQRSLNSGMELIVCMKLTATPRCNSGAGTSQLGNSVRACHWDCRRVLAWMEPLSPTLPRAWQTNNLLAAQVGIPRSRPRLHDNTPRDSSVLSSVETRKREQSGSPRGTWLVDPASSASHSAICLLLQDRLPSLPVGPPRHYERRSKLMGHSSSWQSSRPFPRCTVESTTFWARTAP
ncbi:hypothetical protein EDD85DRAFT_507057 [Armillaria nabsnona]|nr:hypothetical protein EDD85DRAFT_507057 [Armillaria nabsnona]